jgi:hypothetical protein
MLLHERTFRIAPFEHNSFAAEIREADRTAIHIVEAEVGRRLSDLGLGYGW